MAEQIRLLAELGRGPQTIVHRAWDASALKRKVAVKALTESADAETLRRFWSEAEFMAKHRHERLTPVFSVDEAKRWIIMELADGSVAQTIAAGASSAAEVQSVLAQALEGLVVLHDAGRLHGQIKPTNLLTYAGGRIKLSDPAGQSDDGTIPYPHGEEKFLAPELINPDRWGVDVGPSLDLYTLGFVALEMLAGPRFAELFPGMSAGGADQAMLWTRYHAGEEDPRTLVDQLAKGAGPLHRALTLMIAKDRAQRATTAQAVLDVLGKEAIPPQLQQRAAGLGVDTASPAAPAVSTSPASAPSASNAGARVPAALAASRSAGPAKPFLQDTKKVATVAATIVLLGLTAFIAINAFTEETSDKRIASIESDPPDAVVLINDKETKFRTPKRGPVDAGEHAVRVRWADGELSDAQTLSVPQGAPSSDEAPLVVRFVRATSAATSEATPEPTAAPAMVTPPAVAPPLTFAARVEPPDAQVLVAGKPVAVKDGGWEGLFGAGVESLALEASADGYAPGKRSISRAEALDADTPITLALDPIVTVEPPDARVLVDGRETTASDGRFVLTLGDRAQALVSASAPGRYSVERTLSRASSAADRRLSLAPLPPPDSTPVEPARLAWLTPAGVLARHSQRVRSLAVSPNGNVVASAGADRSLIVVRMDGLDAPAAQYGPRAEVVTALAFSSDNSKLYVGELDGSLRAINLADGQEQTLVAPNMGKSITSLAAARIGSHDCVWSSVNASQPDPLTCYDAATGLELWKNVASDAAWDMAFLAAPRLVAHPVTERLWLYDAMTGERSSQSMKFEGQAFHVAADDEGRRVALGLDGAIRGLREGQGAGDVLLWAPDARAAVVWTVHEKAVSGIDFVDRTTLVSTDRSGEIVVTSIPAVVAGSDVSIDRPQRLTTEEAAKSYSRVQTLKLDDPILTSQFHAGSQRLICGMQDGTVRIFSVTPLPPGYRPARPRGVGEEIRPDEREARVRRGA